MVQLGDTSEVIDVVVDERGLGMGPYGTLEWSGLRVSAEAGPCWCTVKVVTATGSEALLFVPDSAFGPDVSPREFGQGLERQAARAGAKVDQMVR